MKRNAANPFLLLHPTSQMPYFRSSLSFPKTIMIALYFLSSAPNYFHIPAKFYSINSILLPLCWQHFPAPGIFWESLGILVWWQSPPQPAFHSLESICSNSGPQKLHEAECHCHTYMLSYALASISPSLENSPLYLSGSSLIQPISSDSKFISLEMMSRL